METAVKWKPAPWTEGLTLHPRISVMSSKVIALEQSGPQTTTLVVHDASLVASQYEKGSGDYSASLRI
jgi:hypothetical protein